MKTLRLTATLALAAIGVGLFLALYAGEAR